MRKPLPIPKGFIVVGRRELEIYNQPGSLDFKDKPSIISGTEHLSRKERS